MYLKELFTSIEGMPLEDIQPDYACIASQCTWETNDEWVKLDKVAGVYLMFDTEKMEILYVGMTENLQSRIKSHLKGSHNLDVRNILYERPETVGIQFYFTNDVRDASLLEALMIWQFKPKFNSTGNMKARVRVKVTDEIKESIYKDVDAGVPKNEVARKYNLTPVTVYRHLKARVKKEESFY